MFDNHLFIAVKSCAQIELNFHFPPPSITKSVTLTESSIPPHLIYTCPVPPKFYLLIGEDGREQKAQLWEQKPSTAVGPSWRHCDTCRSSCVTRVTSRESGKKWKWEWKTVGRWRSNSRGPRLLLWWIWCVCVCVWPVDFGGSFHCELLICF